MASSPPLAQAGFCPRARSWCLLWCRVENRPDAVRESQDKLSTPPLPPCYTPQLSPSLHSSMFEVALKTPFFQPCCKAFLSPLVSTATQSFRVQTTTTDRASNVISLQIKVSLTREYTNLSEVRDTTGSRSWTAFTLARRQEQLHKVPYSYVKHCRKAASQEPG